MVLAPTTWIQLLITYRYFLIFPLMVVEGPIITVVAGFLASLGYFNILIVYVVAILGDLIGDTLYYFLGRFGRKHLIRRWGHYIGITPGKVKVLEKHFRHHSGKTLFAGKISHGIGTVFLVAAGVAKMNYSKFMWYNLLASMPKTLLFLLIGYFFGHAYMRIRNYLDYTALAMVILAIFLVITYFVLPRIFKRYLKIGVK